MSFWSKLAQIGASFIPGVGPAVSSAIGATGSVLSGLSEGKAAGRANQVNAELTEEQINRLRQAQSFEQAAAREADKRESGKSAFRESQYADYVRSGGNAYTPKNGLKSFGFGPKATSPEQRAAAENYFNEQNRRLSAQDSLLPVVSAPDAFKIDPKALKAGLGENIMGAVGGGLSAFGDLTSAAQQRTYLESLMRQNIKLNDEETTLARRLGMQLPADISSGRSNV
jgi:hypothetical protein